jgi:hypothetical protein
LITELAHAMTAVWQQLGLPFGENFAGIEQRTETIASGG